MICAVLLQNQAPQILLYFSINPAFSVPPSNLLAMADYNPMDKQPHSLGLRFVPAS